MSGVTSPAPWRIAFDNARDPYTARNALDAMGSGGGFITSVSSPLSVTGGNLTINLSGYQPLDNELTALAGTTALADMVPYYTGFGSASTTSLTAAARTVLDDATTADMLTTLGAASAASFPAGAWTAWTPTISAGSGTITSTTTNIARYTWHGKTITAHFDISITNAGSGSGFLTVSLPVTVSASGGGIAVGRETVLTGAVVIGAIGSSATGVALAKHDATTLIFTNARIVCNAVYEGV